MRDRVALSAIPPTALARCGRSSRSQHRRPGAESRAAGQGELHCGTIGPSSARELTAAYGGLTRVNGRYPANIWRMTSCLCCCCPHRPTLQRHGGAKPSDCKRPGHRHHPRGWRGHPNADVHPQDAERGVRPRHARPCGRGRAGTLATAAHLLVVSDADGQVAGYAREYCPDATLVVQERSGSWGTGHAVRTVIESVGVIPGTVVVLFSDTPMLRGQTLISLAAEHETTGAAVTVLTAEAPDPKGYGRILRDEAGLVSGIVEDADATEEQRAVTEISSGMFAFDGNLLADAVKRVPAATRHRRGVPDRGTRHPARRRASGRQRVLPGFRRDPGREQPRTARPGQAGTERAAAGPLDGRRGHDRGPGNHLGRRRRAHRAWRPDRAGYPAGGQAPPSGPVPASGPAACCATPWSGPAPRSCRRSAKRR